MCSERRPIDIIREMNPGMWVPTGEELANKLKKCGSCGTVKSACGVCSETPENDGLNYRDMFTEKDSEG